MGLSTKVFSHNFSELIEAEIAALEKKAFSLLPDFQQGVVMNAEEYNKGNGRIRLRAVIKAKDERTLVIQEIPFGVTTDSLISSIEDASRKKKIQIKSIQDFTAERIEIEIKLAAGKKAKDTLQALYAFTQCEIALTGRVVVIHENRPREMDVEDVLRYTAEQLVETLKQELELEQQRLLDELHRKTLTQIFIENRIYKAIEKCKTYEAVQKAVLDGVNRFRDNCNGMLPWKMWRCSWVSRSSESLNSTSTRIKRRLKPCQGDLKNVRKNLKKITAYAIAYL